MTVLAEDLDLSWVEFSESDGDQCEVDDCELQAVCRLIIVHVTDPEEMDLAVCTDHRESAEEAQRKNGFIRVCTNCRLPLLLLRTEPLQ